MTVRPKLASGSAARTVRKVRDGTPRSIRRGRPPKSQRNGAELPAIERPAPQKSYEEIRVEEVRARSEIYKLRLGWLSGELIDRKLLVHEVTQSFTAIRDVILNSPRLTQGEKENLLRNLSEMPVILESLPACTMFQNLS